MKVVHVLEMSRRKELPPLQKRVLAYLDAREDEVFTYRDQELARGVGARTSSIGFTLWALHDKGLIGKQEVAGRVYFGSRRAIESLRKRIGVGAEDPYERARRNREQIRMAVGSIDTLRLLDEVREGL